MTELRPGHPVPAGLPTVRVPLHILRQGDLVVWVGLVRKVQAVTEFPNPAFHRHNDGQLDMFYGHRTLVRVTFSDAQRPFSVQGGSTEGIDLIRNKPERRLDVTV